MQTRAFTHKVTGPNSWSYFTENMYVLVCMSGYFMTVIVKAYMEIVDVLSQPNPNPNVNSWEQLFSGPAHDH